MNPILHQWKWDFRRIRNLWILWLILLIALSYTLRLPSAMGIGGDSSLGFFVMMGKFFAHYVFPLLLLSRAIFTTPFTGTRAFWKTRPLTQTSLFWSKTVFLGTTIFLPILILQLFAWNGLNVGGLYLFWGLLTFGMLVLAMLLVASVWSGLTESFPSFMVGTIGTAVLYGLATFLFVTTSMRSEALPFELFASTSKEVEIPHTSLPISTAPASSILMGISIFMISTLAAWILAGRFRLPKPALITLACGTTMAASANHIWRVDFLQTLTPDHLPEIALTARVLNQDDEVQSGEQLMFPQIAFELPAKQTLHPDYWHTGYRQKNRSNTTSRSAQWTDWQTHHLQRLAAFYPDGPLLIESQSSSIGSQASFPGDIEGTPLHFFGGGKGVLHEWRKIGSIPFEEGARSKLEGGGSMGITKIQQNQLGVVGAFPPTPFNLSPHRRHNQWMHAANMTFVIYHEPSKIALIPEDGYRAQSGMGAIGPSHQNRGLNIQPSKPWKEATGISDISQATDLRLDIFEAVPVGIVDLHWNVEDWVAYSYRTQPKPDELKPTPTPPTERVALGENPTREQVAVFVDQIIRSYHQEMPKPEQEKAERDLRSIGGDHLEVLLSRLPVAAYLEPLVYKAIIDLTASEHRDLILRYLPNDHGLAGVAVRKRWSQEAGKVLKPHLAKRRPLDSRNGSTVISVVAELADPATFEDLRWHFVHAGTGQRQMAAKLAKIPNFPWWKTLEEAWEVGRYIQSGSRATLAPLAARLGDREALRSSLRRFAEDRHRSERDLLAQAVAHPGENFDVHWIRQNFDALRFDKETRRWILPEPL